MLCGEAPQLFYDVSARKRAYDRKRHHAVIGSLQRLHRLGSVLKCRKDGFGVWKECAAGFSKDASTRPSFQQGHPELLL